MYHTENTKSIKHEIRDGSPFEVSFKEGTLFGDPNLGALFFTMLPRPLPNFSLGLLESIAAAADHVRNLVNGDIQSLGYNPWQYVVVNSEYPDIFNLGGDLPLFVDFIRNRDQEGLVEYGKQCIDLTYSWSRSLDLPITGIALVEGTAQGGGLELALASNLIVAERGVKVSLPEPGFKLFAGMGAMHFMSQRIAPGLAQQVFLSGKSYNTEEFYEMGLIDILTEPGEGHAAVLDIIRDKDGRRHAREAIRRMRVNQDPVRYEDLLDTVNYWAEAAMTLSEKELEYMERIVSLQNRRIRSRMNETAE